MANLISLSRILITFLSLYFLFQETTEALIIAVVLIVLQFALDGVDGYVARKLHETSKLGAVLDIMGDRIAENAYWISFAILGWLTPPFPLIVLTRSIVVDSLRSVALEQGRTPFGKRSMQKDPIGQFICCSKFMRILYAVAKAITFVFLTIAYIPTLDINYSYAIEYVGCIAAIISVMLCVLRGLPVMFESKRFFRKKK